MAPNGTRYSVVVGIDYSPLGDAALLRAAELMSNRPNSELHAAHVAVAYGPLLRLDLPDDVRTLTAAEAETLLNEHVEHTLARSGRTGGALSVKTHVRVGHASAELVMLAQDVDADLIVVGTHGRRGVRRLLLGSVAEATLRQAACAVLVVRSKLPRDTPDE